MQEVKVRFSAPVYWKNERKNVFFNLFVGQFKGMLFK